MSQILNSIFFLLVTLSWVSPHPDPSSLPIRDSDDQPHNEWDKALSWLVSQNQSISGIKTNAVDYSQVRRKIDDNHNDFNVYLKSLEHWEVNGLSESEKVALYLNAYNAFSIKIVRDNPCKIRFGKYCWPIRSIRDLGSWGSTIFDLKKGNIGGTHLSLNQISDILRSYDDARILCAMVSSSLSSPDLSIDAYEPDTLQQQLNQSVQTFLSNPDKGLSLDTIANTLYLSDIFDRYESDFVSYSGSVKAFVVEFCPDQNIVESIKTDNPEIKYLDFKWELNTLEQAGVHFSYT